MELPGTNVKSIEQFDCQLGDQTSAPFFAGTLEVALQRGWSRQR